MKKKLILLGMLFCGLAFANTAEETRCILVSTTTEDTIVCLAENGEDFDIYSLKDSVDITIVGVSGYEICNDDEHPVTLTGNGDSHAVESSLDCDDPTEEPCDATITLHVVEIDVLSVPQYVFASANHYTPIKFEIKNMDTAWITSIKVKLMDGSTTLMAYKDVGDYFVADDGPEQKNGESNIYTALLAPSNYDGILVGAPHYATDEGQYILEVEFSCDEGACTLTDESEDDDEDGQPDWWTDETLLAVDLDKKGGVNVVTTSITTADQVASSHKTGDQKFQHFRHTSNVFPHNTKAMPHYDVHPVIGGSNWDVGGYDWGNSVVGTTMTVYTKLEDDLDWSPTAGSDEGFQNEVYGRRRGGYFYVSYGGKEMDPLPADDRAMDTSVTSGNFDWEMFRTGQGHLLNKQEDGGGMNIAGAASALFGLGWAIPNPWAPVFGVASVVFAVVATHDVDSGDQKAHSSLRRFLHRAQPGGGGASVEEISGGPWERTTDGESGWSPQPCSITGKGCTVGDQWCFWADLSVVCSGITEYPWPGGGIQGVFLEARAEYKTNTADDFNNMTIKLSH